VIPAPLPNHFLTASGQVIGVREDGKVIVAALAVVRVEAPAAVQVRLPAEQPPRLARVVRAIGVVVDVAIRPRCPLVVGAAILRSPAVDVLLVQIDPVPVLASQATHNDVGASHRGHLEPPWESVLEPLRRDVVDAVRGHAGLTQAAPDLTQRLADGLGPTRTGARLVLLLEAFEAT